ncbi:hypothetical protein [uncultured Gemmiger sp.]|uniref:hypothetical protein n=1 Tax=uncultured Gemmiger sp. TaxID=1623490 RepID=UPI0027E0C8A9|nr:hypothetical protein [uncultured Gemmiger sp.]
MPNPNRKTLLRALCLTAAGSALFASLYVGSTSAYFTSTATVQVADIQAAATWPNKTGQSDDPEVDAPVFLDEETIAPDTVLAAAPTPAALTAEEPAATPSPTAEPTATPEPTPTATPEPTAEPTPTPAATAEPTPEPTAEPTPEPTVTPEATAAPETKSAQSGETTQADPVAFAAPARTAHRAPQKQATLELYRGNASAAQAFALPNMLPGDTAEKEFTVNVSHRGKVTLYFSAGPDDAAAPLAGGLQLTVTCNNTQLYSGTFADVPAVLPVDVPGTAADTTDAMTYRVTVALPTSAGNEYQNLTMTADLNWWVDELAPAPGTDTAASDSTATSGGATGQLTGKPGFVKALTAMPQTSDSFPLAVVVVIMAVSAIALAALVIAKRKGDDHERK